MKNTELLIALSNHQELPSVFDSYPRIILDNTNIDLINNGKIVFNHEQSLNLIQAIGEPKVILALDHQSITRCRQIYPFANLVFYCSEWGQTTNQVVLLTTQTVFANLEALESGMQWQTNYQSNRIYTQLFTPIEVILYCQKLPSPRIIIATISGRNRSESRTWSVQQNGGAVTNSFYLYHYLINHGYLVQLYLFTKQILSYSDKNIKTHSFYQINRSFQDFSPTMIYCKSQSLPTIIRRIYGWKYPVTCLLPGCLVGFYCSQQHQWIREIVSEPVKIANIRQELMSTNCQYHLLLHQEMTGLNNSELLVPNSELTYQLYYHFYPELRDKLTLPANTSQYSYFYQPLLESIDPNHKIRKYDIAFIANNLDRVEKNFPLFVDMLTNPETIGYFQTLKILIVGDTNHLEVINNLSTSVNIQYYQSMSLNRLRELLSNIKVIVIPSFYDSSPNLAFEADYYGCQILTSPNIGNIPNRWIVCQNYQNINNWIKQLIAILS